VAFDFATFLSTVPAILDARLPVLVRGRHGVGKSEVVYMIAKQRGLPVVERRASQMTEGDLLGLPDTADLSDGRKATTWNAPDWLVTACTEPVVVFLDEVDRATMEVRQGLFELTDSRKINGWHLHPETLIVAAVNGGEHGSQYQVGEMDPAELDRWTVFDVEPSVEDWLQWASSKVYQVSVEDILDRGEFDKIEKWGINDHAAMVEKMQGADTFAQTLTDTQVTNLATWFVSMPSEICMKLWSAIGDAEDENGTNAIRLHKATAADGTRVSEHMVKILRGS
jgi:hypothetical protein